MILTKPKILVFDIETSPIVAHVWGLRDQNISLNQIVKDWQVLAFAAKWLNQPRMFYTDTRHDRNDRRLLGDMWKLLNEADIVITQNGQNFDSRKLNARFIEYGMKPPKPYRHLDTYKIAKAAAEFTSHKLEYLTEKLCTKYKKLSHKKFPGMSLWNECLKGNTQAWNEMKTYNIHDVLSTEELYTKLQGWLPKTAPSTVIAVTTPQCPYCKSYRLRSLGTRKQYKRYICNSCGKAHQCERKEP